MLYASWKSEPVYVDLWGFAVNWTNPNDGWDSEMRESMIDLTNYVLHQSASLEAYTDRGYDKMPIPSDLYSLLLTKRQTKQLKSEPCRISPYTNCMKTTKNFEKVPKNNVQVMPVGDEKEVRQSLVKSLHPILEDWCGCRLSKEVVIYGIRRYLRGSWLSLHVDQVPSHIISVILQVIFLMNSLCSCHFAIFVCC